eukprot:CCRYP_004840-RA/>CCRYP_004840-RA protein AED:0.36 eAED:0.36 QI:0/-1/0/1/-1/1/1/0/294
MSSTATINIPHPTLLASAKSGYIIPGLNKTLISIPKLCAARCNVFFDEHICVVIHKGHVVWTGTKKLRNGLWYVPLNGNTDEQAYCMANDVPYAGGIHQSTSLAETIKFLHQCLFLPTIDMLCKAIDNGQLVGVSHILSALVRKYLPKSTAMAKGHMNQIRKGLRSTTKQQESQSKEELMDFNPPVEDVQEVELFIGATICEQIPGTIYTDQTGHFPVRSFHGKRYQFVAYEYRSNAILVWALADQTDKSMPEAFQDVYAYLMKRGFQPKLNVMDNQCSKTIQNFIKTKGAKIQ